MIQLISTILILLIAAVFAGMRIIRLFRPGSGKKKPAACASCASDCSGCSLIADLSQKKQ